MCQGAPEPTVAILVLNGYITKNWGDTSFVSHFIMFWNTLWLWSVFFIGRAAQATNFRKYKGGLDRDEPGKVTERQHQRCPF